MGMYAWTDSIRRGRAGNRNAESTAAMLDMETAPLTGIRQEEVRALRWYDIGLRQKTIAAQTDSGKNAGQVLRRDGHRVAKILEVHR